MNSKTMMNIFHSISQVDCVRSMGSCEQCPFNRKIYIDEDMAEYNKCLLVEVAKIIISNI